MKTKIKLGKPVYSPVITSVWGLVKNSVSIPIVNSTRWRIEL